MPRTEAIFQWVFGVTPDQGYALEFHSTPDEGLAADLLAARTAREADSLARLHETMDSIHSLARLHEWLFTVHAAYKASLDAPRAASGEVVQAY